MTALIDRPTLVVLSCEQYASRRPLQRVGAGAKKAGLTCENVLGAGEGNRTPVPSLGSSCSTIELHPRGATSSVAPDGRYSAPPAHRNAIALHARRSS